MLNLVIMRDDDIHISTYTYDHNYIHIMIYSYINTHMCILIYAYSLYPILLSCVFYFCIFENGHG